MASILHALKEIVSFIGTLILLFLLVIILFSLGYSVPYLQNFYTDAHFIVPFYLAIPFPIMVFFLEGMAAYMWYILLFIIALASTFYLGYSGIIPYFRDFFKRPFAYRHNPYQELMELFSLSMFFTMLVYFAATLLGYHPSSIGIEKTPLWFQMLQLLHAAVYEELIVRVLFLGLPLFFTYVALGKKLPLIRIFGGGYKIGIWETIYLLISATVFGLAHWSSWGAWKVLPAFVAGLILGYLFLRYGILASIALHFINDFISIPMGIYPEISIPMGILTLYFVIAGLVFFISYSIRVYHHFFPEKKKPKVQSPPSLPPPPPPWMETSGKERNERVSNTRADGWINLRCPVCGGDVFQYVDKNKLRCLKCGAIIDVSAYPEQSGQSEKEDHHPE